jgi:hypothetical protein
MTQIMKRPVAGSVMNYKLKMFWKEAVVAYQGIILAIT